MAVTYIEDVAPLAFCRCSDTDCRQVVGVDAVARTGFILVQKGLALTDLHQRQASRAVNAAYPQDHDRNTVVGAVFPKGRFGI